MGAARLSGSSVLFLAFPVLAILLISGCTTGTTTTGKGVTVKEFSTDFSQVYSGEAVTFRVLLKNEGTVEAKSVHAELLGLDEDWCSPTQGCGTSAGNRLEKWPNEPECKYGGSGFNMIPPDPTTGTEGASHVCTWTYAAPELDKGFTISYTAISRVFYSYKSIESKLINFGSSAEIRKLQDSGDKLPTEVVATSNSPLQVTIETSGPIRFWEGKVSFPLTITVKNLGQGAPCSKTGMTTYENMKDACKATVSGEDSKNRVVLKATLDSKMKFMDSECQALASGLLISLYKGENALSCDVEASDLTDEPTQRAITVEAYYEYFTDTETKVTVIGRRTPGS